MENVNIFLEYLAVVNISGMEGRRQINQILLMNHLIFLELMKFMLLFTFSHARSTVGGDMDFQRQIRYLDVAKRYFDVAFQHSCFLSRMHLGHI